MEAVNMSRKLKKDIQKFGHPCLDPDDVARLGL